MSTARTATTPFREAPTDWLLAGLLLALGAIGLRLVYDVDYWTRVFGEAHSGASIGVAKLAKGDARHKPSGALAWRDFGTQELKVADGASIFTGEAGEVTLSIHGSEEARLAPGTLIVVHAPRNDFGSAGWLKGLLEGLAPRKISAPVNLAVKQGQVAIRDRTLKKGEALVISPASAAVPAEAPKSAETAVAPPVPRPAAVAKPKKAEIRILPSLEVAPAASTREERTRRSLTEVYVKLRWRGNKTVSKYVVEVVHADGTPFMTREISDPEMTITLKSLEHTKYFYQVKAALKDGREITSDRVPITIELPPPDPTEPAHGKAFRLGERTAALIWARTALTEEYRLQVSRDPGFKDLVLNETLTGNLDSFDYGETGRYYWRVQAIVRGKTSPWSETRMFSVVP